MTSQITAPDARDRLRLLINKEPTVVDLEAYRRRRLRLLLRESPGIKPRAARLITRL
jgi:hypothetical protein